MLKKNGKKLHQILYNEKLTTSKDELIYKHDNIIDEDGTVFTFRIATIIIN